MVDDSPTVAVTIETDEFGSVSNLYALTNIEQDNVLNQSAISTSGHLTVVSGLGESAPEIAYYHGIALTDFGLSGECVSNVDIWAPIQTECDLGTNVNNIDQTMYLPRVFVNSIEWTYSAGANAAENFGGETDAKFWFVNNGRFISNEEFVYFTGSAGSVGDANTGTTGGTGFKLPPATTQVYIGLDEGGSPVETVSTRSTGQRAFLRFDAFGAPAVRYYNASADVFIDVEIEEGTGQVNGKFAYNATDNSIYDPLDFTSNGDLLGEAKGDGDILYVTYAANAYASAFADISTGGARGGGTAATSLMATRRDAEYFAPIDASSISTAHKPEDVGAVRHGQIEIYLIDKDELTFGADRDDQIALRVTSVTISADLTREPLFELSHLRPYDRSLTFPIPFTVTVETTAGDLTEYATFASKRAGVITNATQDDVSIFDFMTANTRLDLVVQIYQQTDQEAGGTGSQRRVLVREMVGDEYYQRGQRYLYYDGTTSDPDTSTNYGTAIPASPTKTNTHRERPLKTVIAKDLRITDEGYNLTLGENASQTYGFRGTNRVFAILGEVAMTDLIVNPGLTVNSTAKRQY